MSDTGPKHILVDYGRRSYAFGLRWFVLEEDEQARKAAQAFLKQPGSGYDMFAERKGIYPQYALASSASGLKAGALCAASIVADLFADESWLYVAEIEGAIWITCGREHRIMPGTGDQIFTDVDAAKDAFFKLNPARFKSLVIPASWKQDFYSEQTTGMMAASIDVSNLKDIFQKPSKTTARLENARGGAVGLPALLGGVALMAILAVGWMVFDPFSPSGPSPEEQAEQARLLAEQARLQQEAIYAQLDADRPWELLPPPKGLVEGCLAGLRSMPLTPAGYAFNGGECSAGTVTTSYTRAQSFPSWLREWGQARPEIQIDIDLETSDSFLTSAWEAPPERGPEEIEDYITLARFLNESALLIAGTMSYTQPVQYTYEEYPDYVPLYGVSDLTITTTQPGQWVAALDRLPGIAITTVRLDPDTTTYTLEGKLYVNNR